MKITEAILASRETGRWYSRAGRHLELLLRADDAEEKMRYVLTIEDILADDWEEVPLPEGTTIIYPQMQIIRPNITYYRLRALEPPEEITY